MICEGQFEFQPHPSSLGVTIGVPARELMGVTSEETWTLGRFDRPWAPVRPIFGCIRYMSSAATRRMLQLRAYLARWGSAA